MLVYLFFLLVSAGVKWARTPCVESQQESNAVPAYKRALGLFLRASLR